MTNMKAFLAAATLALSGCATLTQSDALDAYTACAAADVATTTIGLSMNVMHEANPLTNALVVKSLGPVAGVILPVVALSIAGYYILKWLDKPAVTAGVAGLTCVASVRNAAIIRGI